MGALRLPFVGNIVPGMNSGSHIGCHMAGLLLAGSLSAQWEVGLQAGAGTGRINTDVFAVTSRGEYQVVDQLPSWTAGAWAAHPITGKLVFSTGLHWTSIGGHDEHWQRDNLSRSTDHRYHFLSVPMLVQVDLGKFRFGGGYRFGIPLGGHVTYTQHAWEFSWNQQDVVSTTNSPLLEWADMGFVAEATFRGPARLEFGLRYYRGLLDIRDHSDGFMAPLYPEQFVLTVGYRLLPKRASKEVAPPASPEP